MKWFIIVIGVLAAVLVIFKDKVKALINGQTTTTTTTTTANNNNAQIVGVTPLADTKIVTSTSPVNSSPGAISQTDTTQTTTTTTTAPQVIYDEPVLYPIYTGGTGYSKPTETYDGTMQNPYDGLIQY